MIAVMTGKMEVTVVVANSFCCRSINSVSSGVVTSLSLSQQKLNTSRLWTTTNLRFQRRFTPLR